MLHEVIFDNGTIHWKSLYPKCPRESEWTTSYSHLMKQYQSDDFNVDKQEFLVKWVCGDIELAIDPNLINILIPIDQFCINQQMTIEQLYGSINNTDKIEESYNLIISKINPIFNTMYLKVTSILNLVANTNGVKARDKCIEYYDKSPVPSLNRIIAEFYSERVESSTYEEAVNDLERIKKLKSLLPPQRYYYLKATLLKRLDRFEEALVELDKCIELDPKEYSYYVDKGNVLDNLNKSQETIEIVTNALLIKKSAWAYAIRAQAYCSLKKDQEAYDDIQLAIALEPHSTAAIVDRATYLYRLGRHSEALEDYDRIVDDGLLNSENELAEVYSWKANSLFDLKRNDEALLSIDEALKLNPSSGYLYSVKGEMLYMLGRYEEAIQCCSKSIQVDHNYEYGYYMRSLAYRALTIKDTKQACLLDPSNIMFKQHLDSFVNNDSNEI
jgi:tetratricopeptide (TPR) repeat protein